MVYHWYFPLAQCKLLKDLNKPAYPSVFDRICTEIGQQYGCTCVFFKIQYLIWNDFVNKINRSSVIVCYFCSASVSLKMRVLTLFLQGE